MWGNKFHTPPPKKKQEKIIVLYSLIFLFLGSKRERTRHVTLIITASAGLSPSSQIIFGLTFYL
jgi:hypothetical protein